MQSFRRGKKFIALYMHRLIMDAEPDEIIHHKNKNRLDNRRTNLERLENYADHKQLHIKINPVRELTLEETTSLSF